MATKFGGELNSTAQKTDLLNVLDETDRETRAFFEGLSDEDLSKRTDESNWTVGQLAGHIAQVPWAMYVVRRLSQNKDASPPGPLGFVLHLGNWWNARRAHVTSSAQLINTWTSAYAGYRRHIESLPEDVLEHGGQVTGRGRMTVADFVRSSPDHTREHAATIRRALGR